MFFLRRRFTVILFLLTSIISKPVSIDNGRSEIKNETISRACIYAPGGNSGRESGSDQGSDGDNEFDCDGGSDCDGSEGGDDLESEIDPVDFDENSAASLTHRSQRSPGTKALSSSRRPLIVYPFPSMSPSLRHRGREFSAGFISE